MAEVTDLSAGEGLDHAPSGFSGHNVYKATIASGFELLGQVDHWEFCTEPTPTPYSYCYVNPTRSIVIQDDVYTLSNRGLKINPIAALGATTASVPLPLETPIGQPIGLVRGGPSGIRE